MKKVLLGLLVVVSIIFLAGCGKDTNTTTKTKTAPIVGSWEHGSYVYTFNSDGTGNYAYGDTKMEFTYEDTGSEVEILYTGNTVAGKYSYKIEGKKLIIKDSFDNDVEYTKK